MKKKGIYSLIFIFFIGSSIIYIAECSNFIINLMNNTNYKEVSISPSKIRTLSNFPIKGVSLSPIDFVGNFTSFFSKARQAGSILTWPINWTRLLYNTSDVDTAMGLSALFHYTPVLILHPDGELNQSYKDVAVSLIRNYTPTYIGFGNEINGDSFYNKSDPELIENFDNFTTLFKDLCDNISIESPNTVVFTVFQLEFMKGLHGGLFGGVNNLSNNQWSLLNNVSKAHAIAFTTYPCIPLYNDSSDIPTDYYSEIGSKTNKSIIFTEIGWFWEAPAGWNSSSKLEEANFIYKFFELTSNLTTIITIWPFLYDQNVSIPFDKMGLLSTNETTSPAWEAWISIGKSIIPPELLIALGMQMSGPNQILETIVFFGFISGIAVVTVVIIVKVRRK